MSVKFTPNVDVLLPVREYRCELCTNQVFGNESHYQLHLRRRHKITEASKHSGVSSYHCPVEKCQYHVNKPAGRGFTKLKFLRQHYQKIHMVKRFKCNECSEAFLVAHHLEKHQCCSVYACPECELTYGSKASLQTHMRRKNHFGTVNYKPIAKPTPPPKVALPTLKTWKKSQDLTENRSVSEARDEHPQEEEQPMEATYYCLPAAEIPYAMSISAQTETQTSAEVDVNVLPLPSFTDEEVERLLHDMETQTDDVDLDTIDIKNEELVPLLRNMQTQTLDNRHHQGTMTELDLDQASNEYPTYQEQEQMFGLQTSAHTQTCDELFEELGLSHIQTQTHCADGLYNTQHTQTCDEMLDEILENFQSTCTQTRWLDWQETNGNSN